ncbi:MAG: hypothetical protein PVSMB8_05920 [Vulcanimicrobiaceae bacterium]
MRILSAILTVAMTLSLATGGAFAKSHHEHGMSNGSSMHDGMSMHRTHRNHRFGNDKARCRDSRGRFLKRSDPRCLAK